MKPDTKKAASVETETSTGSEKRHSRFSLKNNRKLRIGTTATAITAVVVAVVVLLNIVCGLIADRFPWTLDLTAEKTFTLSEESITVAKSVKKDVEIDVLLSETYFSNPNLGSDELNIVFRQFYLFTKEYQNLSGGHVKVNYVDLVTNPLLGTEYTQKYEASSGDIVFRCGDQHRLISVEDLYEQETDGYTYSYIYSLVEEKLISNITSITSDKKITVAFLTGHGEDETIITSLSSLYQLNGYYTQTIDLSTAAELDPTTEAIVIVGPTQDYANQIEPLQKWLINDGKRGHHLFVYLNPEGENTTLISFLKDYGIEVIDNVVVETDTNSYLPNHPEIPLTAVTQSDLTTSLTGTNKIVAMPATLQLKLNWSSDASTEMDTNHAMVSFGETARLWKKPYTDAVAFTQADEYPIVGMAYAQKHELHDGVRAKTNIVVSGSYLMLQYIQNSQYENEGLALEPLRTLCQLGDVPAFSNKNVSPSAVQYSQAAVSAMYVIFVYGFPAVMMIICLVVFFKRRHL